MAFRTIVVSQHAKVSSKLNLLNIQTDDETHTIPIDDIKTLLLATTNIVITTHAMMKLIENKTEVIFSNYKGFPIANLNNFTSNNQRNATIQKQITWESSKKETLWTHIVKLKCHHQIQLLEKLQFESQSLTNHYQTIQHNDQNNREAIIAHLYFNRLFGQDFARKDEDNPINAHLNYGYHILLSAVAREINNYGCLTELGIHHKNIHNTLNLACDLMEPFRFLIDEITYHQQNTFIGPETKPKLINVGNQDIKYNQQNTLVSYAISSFVSNCLHYLNNKTDQLPELELSI